MRRILKYFYRALLPARISQSLDIFGYLRMSKMVGLNEKNILVLSPHPDDDIIACGGTIHKYHLKEAHITAVYMTDGRKGNNRFAENDLVSIRKEEAQRAARIIGINRLIFLENKDGNLSASAKTSQELYEILNDIKPEAVFLPFFLDNHHDHIATGQIFFSATKTYTDSLMCYCYGIWTPLATSNVISDITEFLDTKLLALSAHKSQLEFVDLLGAVKGISRYYSVLSGLNGYAELFIACSLSEYRRIGKLIGW